MSSPTSVLKATVVLPTVDQKGWTDYEFLNLSSISNDEQRDVLLYLAKLAEGSGRYEDMSRLMKQLVMWTHNNLLDLTAEERNMLALAYKQVESFFSVSFLISLFSFFSLR